GGSSGSVSHLIIPASNLPDVLYVLAGAGGAAVAGNTAGNAGGNSFVSIQPNSTTNNICFRAEGGTAGAVGTVSTGGVAGAAPAATTVGNMFLSYSGQKELLVGFAGATGGISAQGNSVNFGGGCVMGGAGGGGTTSGNVDGSGGTVNGSGIFPQVLGGPGGSGAAGGTDGRMIHQPGQFPFVSTGGTGGGAAGAGTASAGGNGGPGSGGGGAGGNGIIWIICW
ncbi:MAG: hypothetical protein Q8938_20180, partial [Bacteroidota bacterium]|nr:hypothetical protein [Bacteroidota bacterium]